MPREAEIRKKATEILAKGNWIYWYPPKVRFKQNDIFGAFDMVCCKKSKGHLKFIQLTTVSNLSARRKKIAGFLKMNRLKAKSPFSAAVEIWAWNARHKEFKIELV